MGNVLHPRSVRAFLGTRRTRREGTKHTSLEHPESHPRSRSRLWDVRIQIMVPYFVEEVKAMLSSSQGEDGHLLKMVVSATNRVISTASNWEIQTALNRFRAPYLADKAKLVKSLFSLDQRLEELVADSQESATETEKTKLANSLDEVRSEIAKTEETLSQANNALEYISRRKSGFERAENVLRHHGIRKTA